jgi:hypothetical protein
MPNTTSLILASPAAAACQLNPGLTRALLPLLAVGLMDTHLNGWCPMLPDDPRGKRRRMGRLFPRRIVPSVLLGLAAVLDAHREHAHHAPLRIGRAEATRGCRVPLERRGNRRFSSTSCQIAPAERLLSRRADPRQQALRDRWCRGLLGGWLGVSGRRVCQQRAEGSHVPSIQMPGDEPDD